LIVVRSGAYTGDVAMITDQWEGSVGGYDLIVRPNRDLVNSFWLAEYLLDKEVQSYFKRESIRSAQPHLNSKQVLNTKIPVLEIDKQNYLCDKILAFDNALSNIESKISVSQSLLKSLINEVF